MATQFSLFGGEDILAFYRKQDEDEAIKIAEELKRKEEREALARNPSLLDFIEIEKILDKNKCRAPLRCTRKNMNGERGISPETRRSILRSFVTLHLWDELGKSFEKIELWLKTPKACFENETPEEFAFHCWHCTSKWMKNVFKHPKEIRQTLLS